MTVIYQIEESDGTTYDKSRSLNQDLTFTYATRFFEESPVKFEDSNKRTLGLINEDGLYTNASLLISDQCEHSIKCAVYEGIGKTAFKARKEFNGSIFKQMTEAFDFISLSNQLHASIVGLKRIDSPDYPENAIREALLNTIVHREYDYSGSTLINIYSDRMEFISLGGLVKGLTVFDIMRGVSQSRNVSIANIFYRLKLIEGYGTGIQNIMESYEKSRQHPSFLPGPASFVVVLPNMNIHDKIQFNGSLTHDENVLNFVKERGEVTRKDVETFLSCSQFPAFKALSRLVEEGKIMKVGAARSTKYRLHYLSGGEECS